MRGSHRHLNLPSQLAQGVVAAYDFQLGIGPNVPDISGNGNTGVWQGTLGSQWGAGKIGGGGVFNGTDNRVFLGTPQIFNGSFSISTWVMIPGTVPTSQLAIFSCQRSLGNFYFLLLLVNKTPQVQLFDGTSNPTIDTIGTLSPNVFYNIVVTRDIVRKIVTIYSSAPGSTVRSFTDTTIAQTTTNAYIGSRIGSSAFFPGTIGQTIVWKDLAITPNDIATLYNLGQGKAYPFAA
jgi:hypothetical protein